MKKIVFLLAIIAQIAFLHCSIITVSQDGTGDFASIQEAINYAGNDTILVYPGVYFESIDYIGKTLVIGSLNMTTGNPYFIEITVIDGSVDRKCVSVRNHEGEGTKLIGFTICHSTSGAIHIRWGHLDLINCIVENNFCYAYASAVKVQMDSYLFLSGTIIRKNVCQWYSGGLEVDSSSEVEFDSKNLCSIYGNHGAMGQDITITLPEDYTGMQSIYLDTFSNDVPDKFFIMIGITGEDHSNWDYLDWHVNQSYFEFYDGDLYISPEGNDANSGISPDQPMQTIEAAVRRSVSNPLHQNTIYLAEGTYSKELNNQVFPINMRSHVSLIGSGMDTTVLDSDGFSFLTDFDSGFSYAIKNLTFINPPAHDTINWAFKFMGHALEIERISLENLRVEDSYQRVFEIRGNVGFEMDNIIISGSTGGLLDFYPYFAIHGIVKNCIVQNTGSCIRHIMCDYEIQPSQLDVVNCLIVENLEPGGFRDIDAYSIKCARNTVTNLVNCTIMNNRSGDETGVSCIKAEEGADINIYNSCVHGNDIDQVAIDSGFTNYASTVNISHSLIEGGENGIPIAGPANSTLNWLDGNLDTNPLVNDLYYPYLGSPLVNAGTIIIPGVGIPEYDLAGNPRIMDNCIDIGAYERIPWGTDDTEDELSGIYRLDVYPNPFNPQTAIRFNLPAGNDVQLIVYNIKGEKIATIIDQYLCAGEHEFIWNGKTDQNRKAASGVYFCRLQTSINTQTTKMILLK